MYKSLLLLSLAACAAPTTDPGSLKLKLREATERCITGASECWADDASSANRYILLKEQMPVCKNTLQYDGYSTVDGKATLRSKCEVKGGSIHFEANADLGQKDELDNPVVTYRVYLAGHE